MKYLMILLMPICLSSCYNSQKAIDKLERKDPVKLAEYCKNELPCTGIDTVVKSDTLYEFFELICPENTDSLQKDTLPNGTIDSIQINKKTIKQIKITKTITIKELDSASLRIAAIRLADMKETADNYIAKNERKGRLLLWLIIALAVSVIGNVVLIKFK